MADDAVAQAQATLATYARTVTSLPGNATPEQKADFYAAKETLQRARTLAKAEAAAAAAAADVARLKGGG